MRKEQAQIELPIIGANIRPSGNKTVKQRADVGDHRHAASTLNRDTIDSGPNKNLIVSKQRTKPGPEVRPHAEPPFEGWRGVAHHGDIHTKARRERKVTAIGQTAQVNPHLGPREQPVNRTTDVQGRPEMARELITGPAWQHPNRRPGHGEFAHDLHCRAVATEGEHCVVPRAVRGGKARRIPSGGGAHQFHAHAGLGEGAECLAFSGPTPPSGGVDHE